MTKKIFSVPLNPKLTPEQYQEFYNFLGNHRHLIRDVYFTSRIKPFVQDAMGDIFVLQEDYGLAIDAALYIQNTLGIPISATFNNIQVPPTQKNLDIFIANFKPLYDAGIRNATIPHTHWMATGQIKRAFPELYVKNTILREVRTAVEVVKLAEYGFDYINLDRDLMRDRDTLLRIKEAKKWIKENLGKDIAISLLANEGCLGACAMMTEHFEYNNTRSGNAPQYFNDPISRVSCPKWDVEDPAVFLKMANFSPWKEDWDQLLDELGIDSIKMHGRESVSRLYETMEIIRRYEANEEFLFTGFEEYLKETNLVEKPINIWREKIKNCKFDCWECQYCDKIYDKKTDIQYSDLVKHVAEAIASSGVPTVRINVPGLTSARVQTLLNTLARGVDTYLEVGSAMGATFCAVIKDNPLTAIAIDNWKEQIQPATGNVDMLPANNVHTFIENVKPFKGHSNITVVDSDLFEVDINPWFNKVKMWFYDGPHEFENTKRAVEHYYDTLADEAIIVFDDANWQGVVDGARAGLESVGAKITYEKMILNEVEDPNAWWNGLYIVVVLKK
jgi:predicted O-methyltransferase YrrM